MVIFFTMVESGIPWEIDLHPLKICLDCANYVGKLILKVSHNHLLISS